MVIKDALVIAPNTTVTLTADNQVVNVGNLSYVRIVSDNTTAGNRTFSLSAGREAGHILILEFVNIATAVVADMVDDNAVAGTGLRLSAAYALNANDTIMLLWNGANWTQLGRSNN